MADYTQTEVLKAISKTTGIFSEAEMREHKRAGLGILRANEPKVFADARASKEANTQPTKAILFQRDYKVSGGEDSVSTTHEDSDLGGTMERDINYKPATQQFYVSHKMTDRNQFSYKEIFDHKLRQALLNLYRDENQSIVDWLALNKTQVSVDNGIMNWNAAAFVHENSITEKDEVAINMQSVMRANAYLGSYDVVSDQKMFKTLTKLGYNGAQNADNTAAQLTGLSPVEEVALTNATYGGFGYAFEKGMVGMSTWIPRLNRQGAGGIGENGGLFATMTDPVYGAPLAVHVYRKGADTQASGGERQDIVDYYQFLRYNTIGGAFLSQREESPILAFGQLKA